jgi:hypothetical protein
MNPIETKQSRKPFDYPSFMLSIATAGTIACFGFLWNLNVTVTKLEEHDTQKTNDYNDLKQTTNKMQLDIQWLREQAIRSEHNEKQATMSQTN